jgi:stalled ribosome alternative rescue factor ArfA
VAPISEPLFLLLEKERTKKKQKGAYSRDRNRKGEKFALANQHISAIVFVIKLQHQADIEETRRTREAKKTRGRESKKEAG